MILHDKRLGIGDQDPTAARALADLAQAAGAGGELDLPLELKAPSEGQVPLAPLGWLVLAAEEHGLSLDELQAGAGEVVESLCRDIPLLTAIEEEHADGTRVTRWLLLRRGPDGTALWSLYEGAKVDERQVPLEQLAAELGTDAGQRLRWVTIDRLPAPDGELGAAPGGATISSLRRLWLLVRADRRDLLAVAAFAIAVGVLLLATPIAVQALVNFVALGGAIPPLIVVVVLLFLGLCFAGILSALQTWVVEILQRRIFVRAVADLSARLPRVAIGPGNEGYGPELVNRFFDLETIQKRGSFLLLDGLSVLLSVLVGLVVLAFYHPLLLAFDILLLAVIALIVLGPIRKGIRTAKAESSAKYEVAAWLEEIARNPVLFKSSGVMNFVFERSDRLARTYLERRATHFRVAFGQGLAAIGLQVLASTALLGIGGLLVIRGSLTLGQLVAAELILTLVVSSVAKMGKHLEAFYDLMAATNKVGILLDLPMERTSGELHVPGADAKGATLDLRSIGWTPSGAAPLFKGVSLQVGSGERIGIGGPSGSGKSTLLQLAWGIMRPSAGSLWLDGRDLREVSMDSVRRTASLLDRIELFDGTVRENVHLERPFVGDEDVRSALRLVGLEDDLSRLPEGVDTLLQVDGRPLSSGQLVRLQVARAIASRPRLLLVSDFFGGLEGPEREQVLDILFDPEAPWTLVFVSNSPRALERCDRTYRLSQGILAQVSDTKLAPA